MFFLDYIACGKNYPEKIATIVSGVAEGCKQSECCSGRRRDCRTCRDFMPVDEYDLAGFAVGVVDEKDIITVERISNRGTFWWAWLPVESTATDFLWCSKVFEMTKESLDTYYDELG